MTEDERKFIDNMNDPQSHAPPGWKNDPVPAVREPARGAYEPAWEAGSTPTLSYRPVGLPEPTRHRAIDVMKVLAACVGSALVVFATVFVVILISLDNRGLRSYWWPLVLMSTPVLLLLLVSWPIYRGGARMWAIGIWLGLGVAALVEGVCFAGTLR